MTSEPSADDGQRDEIERLAEDFLERRRRGERPTLEEYTAARPELADEIRALFRTLCIVEDLGADLEVDGLAAATTAVAEHDPTHGLREIGDFRIRREIGRGGMGVVYEAEQISLGRRVALKVLPFHSLLDERRLERFRREARAAARLSHPNIVPVHGVGEHLGMHFYVMQLIPGHGLHHVIAAVRRLRKSGGIPEPEPPRGTDEDLPHGPDDRSPADETDSSSSLAASLDSGTDRVARDRYHRNVARLARDAALALDYAHAQGILHRDVKPSNLLLDPLGRIWLTDFGLAKAADGDDLTHSEDIVGTVLYMAPERFQGWSDPRSDVYALGITLYELLTLRPAYVERDRAQLLRRVTTDSPPAPRRVDHTIPRDLETIVLEAIARDAARRYPSARAMALDLDRFLDGRPVAARRSRALARFGRWCARNPLPAGLTAMVFVLLAVVAGVSIVSAVRLASEQAAGRETLRAAYLAEANARRASATPGRRFEALEALRRAAEIRPGADLVDEAVACLALVDARLERTWEFAKGNAMVLSPSGDLAALARADGEIIISDANDDRELARLPAPGFLPAFNWPRFSPRGRYLVVRHQEQSARSEWRVWDVEQRVVAAEVVDGSANGCAAFSPDERWVILGTRKGGLRIVDLASGSVSDDFGDDLQVASVAVHPGARLIAMASDRTRRVHVWDRSAGRVIRTLAGENERRFTEVSWHRDGRTLAAAGDDHLVYVWNAESGERSRELHGHWAEVRGVGVAPRGGLLVSWGWDPAARFWDATSDRPIFTIHAREGHLASDESWFWTLALDRVSRWELAPAHSAFTLIGHEARGTKQPHSVALARGGRLAASSGDDGVRLWDLAARDEVAYLAVGRVSSVFFDTAGTSLYASGRTGLRRWRVRTLDALASSIALGPEERITQLDNWERAALAADAPTLVAAHAKTHAHVLDPESPNALLTLDGLTDGWYVAVSADGSRAAAGSWRGEEVLVFNALDGTRERTFAVGPARVAFHPDGAHVATCSPSHVTLWRIEDGEPVWTLEREPSITHGGSIVFARDGSIAAFAQNDSRIRVVDATSGKKLLDVEATEPIHLSSIALEGDRLVAATIGHRLHVWDLRALERQVSALGLAWPLPSARGEVSEAPEAPALRVAVLDPSVETLVDEGTDVVARELFRPATSSLFRTELVSAAEIDQALAEPQLWIPAGASWRYWRGRADPTPSTEWTSREFGASRWETGPSALTGSRPPEDGPDATFLADQIGAYSTLYLRHAFTVASPGAIDRLVLAVESSGGFVAYLNGTEIARIAAGESGKRLSSRANATRQGGTLRTEVVEIPPGLLVAERNVLAIQAIAPARNAPLAVLPVLAAVESPAIDRDLERTAHVYSGGDGSIGPFLRAYRDGRVLQRSGRPREALREFARAGELDPRALEPLLRRVACHRALGELETAEALARGTLERDEHVEADRLWRAWEHVVFADLHREPAAVLDSLPRADRTTAAGDHRWLLTTLAAGERLRINCGGGDCESAAGERWSRDRFFIAGSRLADAQDDAVGTPAGHVDRTQRTLPGIGSWRRGYSIPLPPGRYRVSLRLPARAGATSDDSGDFLLEDRVTLEGSSTKWFEAARRLAGKASPEIRTGEVIVADGALEIDAFAEAISPSIAGIEIERLGAIPTP